MAIKLYFINLYYLFFYEILFQALPEDMMAVDEVILRSSNKKKALNYIIL